MNKIYQAMAQQAGCQVKQDQLTRQLYATDASIYKILPAAVAFPQNAEQVARLISLAGENNLSVTLRGAGTGLAGGAVGSGLVIDLARYHRKILAINREARTAIVQPGVILDQLDNALKPYGLWFGPDVATSSRATLGGMISNNSSGARAPFYGTTADHISSLKIILADGRIIHSKIDRESTKKYIQSIKQWLKGKENLLKENFSPGLIKRWPGYGLNKFFEQPDICKIISGSEGTLAAVVEAEVNLSLLPKEQGLAVIAFDSISEAMQSTVELQELSPVAIEHIDRILFDQTKGQPIFQEARDFLSLDRGVCQSLILIEFYHDIADKLEQVQKLNLGLRTIICKNDHQKNLVWEIRKAGLGILTGCPGAAKPTAGIEDAAVLPSQLPDYVKELQKIMKKAGTEGSFYGHAASGLLHIRPVLNLHQQEDRKKLRAIADDVAVVVKEFKGSLAAEHGVGIARTEYLADSLGPELMEINRQIKNLFDPDNIMNPGKIVCNGSFAIDTNLRWQSIKLPFSPQLAFAAKDHSIIGNLEQCDGSGTCLKTSGAMCPSYQATGEEIMSTRGRSNIIRALLQKENTNDVLRSKEIAKAIDYCLSCKACKTECPSNVDMALIKTELLHAKHQKYGMAIKEKMVANIDRLAKWGCRFAPFVNFLLMRRSLRKIMEKTIGIKAERPMPSYAGQRFDHWFEKHNKKQGDIGKVILWDDTFVRHHEPEIGRAVVSLLEKIGFEVELLKERQCCGRPAFSAGNLDRARNLAKHNIAVLEQLPSDMPVIFLEPSCFAMITQDYEELKQTLAKDILERCFLLENFIFDLWKKKPQSLPFSEQKNRTVAFHTHCHVKNHISKQEMIDFLNSIPGTKGVALETGCCGMAGAFGADRDKYELSCKIAEPLLKQINSLEQNADIVFSGTSCRQQITHLSNRKPVHFAQFLVSIL